MKFFRHERQFLRGIAKHVDTPPALQRQEGGRLWVSWLSPCSQIGSLAVLLRSREVMLSCNASHTHVELWQFSARRLGRRYLSPRESKRLMIAEAIDQTVQFLSRNVVVSIWRDARGRPRTSGFRRITPDTKENTPAVEVMAAIYGEPLMEEAWTWFGAWKQR